MPNLDPAPDTLERLQIALPGGDVADVVGATNLLRQLQIPGNLPPLALRADAPVAVGPGVGPVVDIAAAEQAVVGPWGSLRT